MIEEAYDDEGAFHGAVEFYHFWLWEFSVGHASVGELEIPKWTYLDYMLPLWRSPIFFASLVAALIRGSRLPLPFGSSAFDESWSIHP